MRRATALKMGQELPAARRAVRRKRERALRRAIRILKTRDANLCARCGMSLRPFQYPDFADPCRVLRAFPTDQWRTAAPRLQWRNRAGFSPASWSRTSLALATFKIVPCVNTGASVAAARRHRPGAARRSRRSRSSKGGRGRDRIRLPCGVLSEQIPPRGWRERSGRLARVSLTSSVAAGCRTHAASATPECKSLPTRSTIRDALPRALPNGT